MKSTKNVLKQDALKIKQEQQVLRWDELMEAAQVEMSREPVFESRGRQVRHKAVRRNLHQAKDDLFCMIDANIEAVPLILHSIYSYYQRRGYTTHGQNVVIKAVYHQMLFEGLLRDPDWKWKD